MIDRYGRVIDCLKIAITDKCNLQCVYCKKADTKYKPNYINDVLNPEDIKFLIKVFSENGIKRIKFVGGGGEPTLHPNLPEFIKYAKECGIRDISLTTNGTTLSRNARLFKECGLTNVNVSVDSLKQYKYRAVTRVGNLNEVLTGIDNCLRVGLNVKINCVAIKDFNDNELVDFIQISRRIPIDVRFIEFMPYGEAKEIYKRGHYDIKSTIESLPGIEAIENRDKGSIATYYKVKGSKGRIGVITPMNCSFCDKCDKINITHDGMLRLCTHSKNEIDLKPFLQKPYLFNENIKKIISAKPRHNTLIKRQFVKNNY
ncbi:GTP 3',8-cyclase MoaA [Peptacetobacter sp.]|uniref:GTP 3',8-cyclase MoaA n=1 Tax=Peptacetobacter sp. TaxID=2991975 RepID=UPI00261A77FE|nr:GTP 3',8-cyclase MoaA [Peptacetobacter sp.]